MDTTILHRYAQCIVAAQKVKDRLSPKSTTNMQSWMMKLVRSMVGLFPIIFHRIIESNRQKYGFDESSFRLATERNRLGTGEDLVETVEEFLRLEEKSGPQLGIALVLDDTASHQEVNFSRNGGGYRLVGTSTNHTVSLASFPPIFLRTTQPTRSVESRRNASQIIAKSYGGGEGLFGMRQRNHSSVFGTETKEEDDNSPPITWPQKCWDSIVTLLPTT